ncbi:NAD(P)-binding protein, partial [Wolfiporia cocos MD-104 SS10]
SRGLGLAVVAELMKDPENAVVATARNTKQSSGLQELVAKYSSNRLKVITMDISDSASVEKAVEEVTTVLPSGIDCLIHNGAISLQPTSSFAEIDLTLLEQEFRVNTIGPLRVARAFLPLVRKSTQKKIVYISSTLGSIAASPTWIGLSDAYSLTKAALNMHWGSALNAEGITTILINPGWLDTDMGRTLDDLISQRFSWVPKLSADESAVSCIRIIKQAKLEDTVGFYNYDGTLIPW